MLLMTTVVLYGLGAVLMRTRLALLEDVQLADLPAPTPAAAVPVTIAIVLLWPVAVVLYTWLAVVLLRPGRTRRRGRLPAPPRERTPGSSIEPS